jgi:hypothetical protein
MLGWRAWAACVVVLASLAGEPVRATQGSGGVDMATVSVRYIVEDVNASDAPHTAPSARPQTRPTSTRFAARDRRSTSRSPAAEPRPWGPCLRACDRLLARVDVLGAGLASTHEWY